MLFEIQFESNFIHSNVHFEIRAISASTEMSVNHKTVRIPFFSGYLLFNLVSNHFIFSL